MSIETIQPNEMDEPFLSDARWRGVYSPHMQEALGSPLPPTVFERVAVEPLPAADKKNPTFQIIRTTYWLPTGTKKNPDSVKAHDTKNEKD